jgi:peptidyl-prolyl cis-trans isomerase B (cyclophilin B)
MHSKYRAASSWWVALWIYVVTFLLVTLTFFQATNAEENEARKLSATNEKVKDGKTEDSKDKKKNSSAKKGKGMLVVFETNQGSFKIKLEAEKAPKSVENFLKYVDDGFYNGTIFHRVIKGFMIQGGGFTADLNQKPTKAAIKNEANNGLLNKRGTLAMARTMDPNSATAQFFVNLVDNTFLDFKSETMQGWGYAVFGEVVEGMDVVDKIAALKTTRKQGYDDVPELTVEIKSTKRVEK